MDWQAPSVYHQRGRPCCHLFVVQCASRECRSCERFILIESDFFELNRLRSIINHKRFLFRLDKNIGQLLSQEGYDTNLGCLFGSIEGPSDVRGPDVKVLLQLEKQALAKCGRFRRNKLELFGLKEFTQ
jgi:hypothetical protein